MQKEISLLSFPITSDNQRNMRNRPVTNLGCQSAAQLLSAAGIRCTRSPGCIIGNPGRSVPLIKQLTGQSKQPWLYLGAAKQQSLVSPLRPDWALPSAQETLPGGNGAILFSSLEYPEHLEKWGQGHFVIIDLTGGLQITNDILSDLCSIPECLILCDSVPNAIRESDPNSTASFLKKMKYIILFSLGNCAKEIVEFLPTYQYEQVSNTTNFNMYTGHHHGHAISIGQSRTANFEKSVFEDSELQYTFNSGAALAINSKINTVFVARLV